MKNNLKVERAILRVAQQQLAERAGASRQTIVASESGKYVPSAVWALKKNWICNKKEAQRVYMLNEGEQWKIFFPWKKPIRSERRKA